jgi:hypothetical protein
VSLFYPLIESYSSLIPKYKHTPDRWFIYYFDSHTVMVVNFSSRTSTDKVHTVHMLSKDMILASKNFELLASLASVLKILIPPLHTLSAFMSTRVSLNSSTESRHYETIRGSGMSPVFCIFPCQRSCLQEWVWTVAQKLRKLAHCVVVIIIFIIIYIL